MVYVCAQMYFMQSCTHSLPFWLLLNTVCYYMFDSVCDMLSQLLCVCVCELTGYIITGNAHLMLHCRKKTPAVKTPRKGGKQSGKSPVQQVGIVMYQDAYIYCEFHERHTYFGWWSALRLAVLFFPTRTTDLLFSLKAPLSHHLLKPNAQTPQIPAVCCGLLPSSPVTSEWTELTCIQVGVLCRCVWCPLSPSHGHGKLVQHVHSFATVLRTCPNPFTLSCSKQVYCT